MKPPFPWPTAVLFSYHRAPEAGPRVVNGRLRQRTRVRAESIHVEGLSLTIPYQSTNTISLVSRRLVIIAGPAWAGAANAASRANPNL